jgi:two-component system, response regulator YesN
LRSGEQGWTLKLEKVFKDIRHDQLSIDDTNSLMNYYLIILLNRGISELSEEIQEVWKDSERGLLVELLEESETLEEMEQGFFRVLSQTEQSIITLQHKRSYHRLIKEIRDYIKQNFKNPDLSLDLLSREFDINPKYLSQLFKDECGERFMDFLLTQRIELAKKLLLETEDQIQDISVKVGYLNAISFARAFKKVTGLSPGDYRKLKTVEMGDKGIILR